VDRCHERRAGRVHAVTELLDPARRTLLLRIRSCLPQGGELLDVRSGHECPLSRAGEHDRAHAVVVVEAVDLRLELLEERRRELVQRRVLDRDDGDVPVLLRGDEVAH